MKYHIGEFQFSEDKKVIRYYNMCGSKNYYKTIELLNVSDWMLVSFGADLLCKKCLNTPKVQFILLEKRVLT